LTPGRTLDTLKPTAVIYGHLLPPGRHARTKELKRRTVSSALHPAGGFFAFCHVEELPMTAAAQ
jgi:hypothetical protein